MDVGCINWLVNKGVNIRFGKKDVTIRFDKDYEFMEGGCDYIISLTVAV